MHSLVSLTTSALICLLSFFSLYWCLSSLASQPFTYALVRKKGSCEIRRGLLGFCPSGHVLEGVASDQQLALPTILVVHTGVNDLCHT